MKMFADFVLSAGAQTTSNKIIVVGYECKSVSTEVPDDS